MSLRFMTLFLSDGSFCCWQAAATPADYQPQVYEPVCGWASTPRQVAMRCLGPRTLLRWPASERCLARGHLGDLGRFYALEEFYAQDLEGYYSALVTHPHHNYYEGRNEAEITPWLSYFLRGIANVFDRVAEEVRSQAASLDEQQETLLRRLDRRGRIILGLFARQEQITTPEIARALGLSERQARDLVVEWAVKMSAD